MKKKKYPVYENRTDIDKPTLMDLESIVYRVSSLLKEIQSILPLMSSGRYKPLISKIIVDLAKVEGRVASIEDDIDNELKEIAGE